MRRLLLVLILLAATSVQAEPQTLADGQVIRGRFTQERHLQGFANPIKSDGRFVLAPGRGLLWIAEHPFPVTTAITADGLSQSVAGRQTSKLDAQRLPFLAKLYAMMGGALAGKWDALGNEFSLQRDGNRVTLTPLHEDATGMAVKRISLTVGRFVDEVEIEKPGGDTDHLTFTGQSLSADPLSPEETEALGQVHP